MIQEDAVPLIWTSNGEAGDGQDVCSGCGEERDEPHAVGECAETKRRLDEVAESMVTDFLKTPGQEPSTCCSGDGCENCYGSGLLSEQPLAIVERFDSAAHDGAGWYYYSDDYRDEGSVGAFGTREEAEAHARDAGYRCEVRS